MDDNPNRGFFMLATVILTSFIILRLEIRRYVRQEQAVLALLERQEEELFDLQGQMIEVEHKVDSLFWPPQTN
jgi:hypothetical protein